MKVPDYVRILRKWLIIARKYGDGLYSNGRSKAYCGQVGWPRRLQRTPLQEHGVVMTVIFRPVVRKLDISYKCDEMKGYLGRESS